ncbi:hypothetical protein [Streptomyces cavernicola]|uniref:Prephenate dehydratase n=1 Tax=Streptomyces cavernicola TaxID=3043613 RepID=A0ABT6SC77_9ACTN|nr:hypothetical protein [Streptomyces sp. B-S-A6]MDI3405796.1 hypothetical protein [Streptomyces sp. B-S-A6]
MAMRTDAAAPPSLGAFAEEYTARWSRLTGRWAARPGTSLGTLGPAGTSSDLAARFLAAEHGLSVELFTTFDDVLDQLLGGHVEFALVPSAYQGITRFHWHRSLRLQAFFAQATPEYGVAAASDEAPARGDGPVTVAAMWEVRRVYAEVVPQELRDREVTWVDAASTQHAAEIVAAGGAELAVTNAPGVRVQGLRWLARRPGAEIVWTLFGRAEEAEAPSAVA